MYDLIQSGTRIERHCGMVRSTSLEMFSHWLDCSFVQEVVCLRIY